jgi:release factor glutamine methyltransferase
MTIHDAYTSLSKELKAIYDDREAVNIADWLIENITGKKKIDRILNKQTLLNSREEEILKDYTAQLLQHKPVQYVLNEAWFAGMKLYVDEAVLIPRPETEELVEWIVSAIQSTKYEIQNEANSNSEVQDVKFKMLDVGTGSGCIAAALKKNLPKAEVTAIDVSEDALKVAKRNAVAYDLDLYFIQVDFLDKQQWKTLSKYDVIVSNPPYIKKREENSMNRNVLEHEPHLALFVPDDDALMFYKALAEFAQLHLNEHGSLYVEINQNLGKQVVELFEEYNYQNIILKKDLQGNDRMIRATKTL